jgi:hypothetical protein
MTDNGNAPGRGSKLQASMAKLRSRSSGSGGLERWLLLLGGGMVIVGVPIIVLGWYGASHTPYVFEQVPYLISGGLLGLALALLGGLFYFAYWITKQIQETRKQSEQTKEALGEIRDLLAGSAIAVSGKQAKATGNGAFVATEKGTMFHRSDCVVVQGRDDLRTVDSGSGLEPCKICEPLAVS